MNIKKAKIIRTSTIPASLNVFCNGLLKELSFEGYEVVAVSSPGEDLQEIENREDIRTCAVPMQRHMSPVKDLLSLIGLIKIFRREKPTMVHSMTPKAGLLSMLAAWFCRVPIRVHTFTGLVFPTAVGFTKKILIFTDRLTCACATNIIPEGEGVKEDLYNYKITNKPLKVLGHGNVRGIDLNHYSKENNEILSEYANIHRPDVITFIFVGRLVGDKGINELIVAFKRLNAKVPQSRLILVGPKEEKLDPLKPDTLREIETNSAIEAVGRQKDVRPWLAASDCLAFPSYREGFPNVVIEAGAMELPSIVTDINGSREIIIEGENGTIVPPHDSDALYNAMLRMATDTHWRQTLGSKARGMVASRYEQSYVRKCLKDFYKEILSK